MKKILITGLNSYIGTSFENYVGDMLNIDKISLLDDNWKTTDFSIYDAIFHVAGIAHSDNGKIDEETKALYYSVNTDLAVEVATKAKSDGVKQFIYMSSIIIFGESAPIGNEKIITSDTIPTPLNAYGDSKLQAEIKLKPLNSDNFKIAIVRPPMVYGKGSKGNYPLLSKFAKKTIIFPNIENKRSMIHIDNLCEFISLIIKNEDRGIFMPQNSEYVATSNMVKMIGQANNKNIKLTKIFNIPLKIIAKFLKVINKAFGSLTYDMKLSEYKEKYIVIDLEESITRTEV